jgi:hypothetical protein
MRWGLRVLLILSFFFSYLVDQAFAEPFNLTSVPESVGNQLMVGAFVGGLLVSILILLLILVPVMIMTKGKAYTVYIILSLSILTPLVAMGWFNFWVFIVIVLAISVGVAQKVADFLGGIRK